MQATYQSAAPVDSMMAPWKSGHERGATRWSETDPAPADSPKIVTR